MTPLLFVLTFTILLLLDVAGLAFMERETDTGDWTVLGFRRADNDFAWRVSFSRSGPDGERFRWNAFRLGFEDGSVTVLSCPVGAIGLCMHARKEAA